MTQEVLDGQILSQDMSPIIISVEGNIGSGKSTLVTHLQGKFQECQVPISFVPEPVEVWSTIKDESGESILEKFYADQPSYSFSFQMMAYISRVSALRTAIKQNPNGIVITERSVQTDRNVFAKMLYDQGQIRSVDYQIYLKWFDEFSVDLPISGLIYVAASPTTCQYRVTERNRQGETIPLDYLERCGQYHQEWIDTLPSHRICELDGNLNIKTDPSVLDGWFQQITQFIQPDDLSIGQQSH